MKNSIGCFLTGLTAVESADIMEIMFNDFPHKYDEFRKYSKEKKMREQKGNQKNNFAKKIPLKKYFLQPCAKNRQRNVLIWTRGKKLWNRYHPGMLNSTKLERKNEVLILICKLSRWIFLVKSTFTIQAGLVIIQLRWFLDKILTTTKSKFFL